MEHDSNAGSHDLDDDESTDEPISPLPDGYGGGKWGIYLRAPDVYFDLIARTGTRQIPMAEVANISYGIKSGNDNFFYVHDVTDEEIARLGSERFTATWSISPSDTNAVRVIRAGDGSAHLIEATYLTPILMRPNDFSGVIVNRTHTNRYALDVGNPMSELQGTFVAKYIQYGERRNIHQGSSVRSRRLWYDLGLVNDTSRAEIIWQKAHQYEHSIPRNADNWSYPALVDRLILGHLADGCPPPFVFYR